MSTSLTSMSSSCLQQRDPTAYPYMFHHDPLHQLSTTYNQSRAAAVSAACNSAVAHAQSAVNAHPSYGSATGAASAPSTGTGKH